VIIVNNGLLHGACSRKSFLFQFFFDCSNSSFKRSIRGSLHQTPQEVEVPSNSIQGQPSYDLLTSLSWLVDDVLADTFSVQKFAELGVNRRPTKRSVEWRASS
jgi:hypothetical protein